MRDLLCHQSRLTYLCRDSSESGAVASTCSASSPHEFVIMKNPKIVSSVRYQNHLKCVVLDNKINIKSVIATLVIWVKLVIWNIFHS